MPAYSVSFYTAEGRYHRRTVDADSSEAASMAVRRDGLHPVSVKETARDSRASKIRLTVREQIHFFELLELHLAAEVRTVDALEDIRNTVDSRNTRKVVEVMYRGLSAAKLPISECFALFPRSFPEAVVSVLRAGEGAGVKELAKAFTHIRERLEYDEQKRAQIKRGLSYPALLIAASFGLIIFVMLYFVPKAAALLHELNAPMPLFTQRVIGTAEWMMHHWPMFAALLFVPAIVRTGRRIPGAALALDKLFLHLPIFSRIYREIATAQFAHYYNSLRSAGGQPDEVLTLCETLSGNLAWQASIRRIRENVTTAKLPLWEACQAETYFPRQAVSLIRTGEKNGNLDLSFGSIAKYYAETARQRIDDMLQWLTPVVTVVLAVVVFGILYALFSPLFSIIAKL
jgi:type IV pilus assembly protein PilC